MHELAVTENILQIATRHAQAVGASRITDLYLVIGQFSSIIDDSVQFFWDIISEGTIAEGAELHFKRVPAEMTCQTCKQTYQPADYLVCPQCDSSDVRLIRGGEFLLESIEVNQDQEANVLT